MKLKICIYFLFLVLIVGCTKQDKSTKVKLTIINAQGRKISIIKLPFKNEGKQIIDSMSVKQRKQEIDFVIDDTLQRVFRVNLEGKPSSIYFINDSKDIILDVNYAKPQLYNVNGSAASISWKNFNSLQTAVAEKNREMFRQLDSLKKSGKDKKMIDSLSEIFNQSNASFFQAYKKYADTVTNPAAFLAVYNLVDFGDDHEAQKKFMIKAASRFPNYSPIQKLKDETIEYVKIFEEEYNVGDQLPTFSLPDESGIPFYTQSLKGKYVLMNFWSTWCPQCFNYMEAERKVKDKYPSSKIEVISVAIDNEKDVWKQIIAQRKYDWKQLIDEDMWQGRTVKALKFDSIPFNFLISPEGKVLAKAIKPDSMLIVLSQKVK